MPTLKKTLTCTAAVVALMGIASPAFAAVIGHTTEAYVSGTGTPAATTKFGVLANTYTVDNVGTGFTSAFVAGNNITFTLSQGLYDVLPTATPAGGGSLTYVSGGAASNQITFSIVGTVTSITLSNVQANTATSVADASTLNINITDAAGGLAGVTASSKRFNVATFNDPYTATFTPAAAVAAQVDLGATIPGSRYTNTNTATLGTITVTPNATALRNWANGTPVGATTTSTALITLPGAPFTTATLSSGCGAAATATAAAANIVTFTLGTITATGTGACVSTVVLQGPTTGGTLLAAGSTSAAVTVGLTPSSLVVGTSRSFSGALNPISYAGGAVVSAGYSVGTDAAYGYFINVSNGSTAGPVIVQASVGGFTGTAVLSTSLSANTSSLYSMDTIRTALIAAGMPSGTTFADPSQRGNIQVVVPTGARVTPLLRNSSNTQVIEIQSRGTNN